MILIQDLKYYEFVKLLAIYFATISNRGSKGTEAGNKLALL